MSAQVAVQQSVKPENTVDAMYKLADVRAQIDSYVSDVVRSSVPHMTLDEAFEKKDDVSNQVMEKLQKEMSTYGFVIHKALVTELVPNQEVVHSMNEINKQKRLRDAAIMAAEAEKVKVVKAAEAAADAVYSPEVRQTCLGTRRPLEVGRILQASKRGMAWKCAPHQKVMQNSQTLI